MTLRHYKIFVTVCDTMNMTTAGEKLYLSQSAVSQAIAELESHYETRLFERLSRKLYLTQSGQKLLSYARHIIRMNEEADYEMKKLQSEGNLRIGASVTVCTCILPTLVSEFQKSRPKALVEVNENNTEVIENMILQDQIDLALVEGDIHSTDIICNPFMEDNLIFVCGKNHRFCSQINVTFQDIMKENFIIRETGSGTRKTFEDVMSSHHINWKASWICNNTDTIKSAVKEGLGITVLPERVIPNELERGELVKFSVDGLEFKRTFKICYHKNKYLSDLMHEFMLLTMKQKGQ